MLEHFSPDYSQRSDDELLRLASDRASLTPEAGAALEAELRRRNLTNADQAEYQRRVKRYKRWEAKTQIRLILDTPRYRRELIRVFFAVVVMVLILEAYLGLPNRYQMNPDREEAAAYMMLASVLVAVSSNSRWRKIVFWMLLVISSSIHVVIIHAWIQRMGSLSLRQGALAILLGLVQFYTFNALVWLLRRKFYGVQAFDDT
jgi:hypothetical protein